VIHPYPIYKTLLEKAELKSLRKRIKLWLSFPAFLQYEKIIVTVTGEILPLNFMKERRPCIEA